MDWSDDFEMEFLPVENIPTQKQPVLTVISHASSSVVDNSLRYWTKGLTVIPNITHEFLNTYFTAEATNALKHKTLGYQLFKDGYVKNMRVKLNVPDETEMLFLVKCDVTACMRKIIYHVQIHLSQLSGSVLSGNCNYKSGLSGCCKHVVAALYTSLLTSKCVG